MIACAAPSLALTASVFGALVLSLAVLTVQTVGGGGWNL